MFQWPTQPALTFDDVLLVPQYSEIKSRKDVDVSSKLTNNIKLQLPIISSNMTTVTESDMAIVMARLGGVGVIHRFMDMTLQACYVERVKRSEGYIIEKPIVVDQDDLVKTAKQLMDINDIGGLIVIDSGDYDRVSGIVTRKDIQFSDPEEKIKEEMTSLQHMIYAQPGITLEEAKQILRFHNIEKLPILKNRVLKGLITSKDILKKQRYPKATIDKKGRLVVGAAIGVNTNVVHGQTNDFDRARKLLEAGVDFLVIDIAHGDSRHCLEMIRQLIHMRINNNLEFDIIAGNVATLEGASHLASAGVDAIKVGIGGGSICTTRKITGFGVPQLTAIESCVDGSKEWKIPVIADGGIRGSDDIVKALAVGASTVMVGNLLAGCKEAPGIPIVRNGIKYKVIRGSASREDIVRRELNCDETQIVPEGVEGYIPYKGEVKEVLNQLEGGLRSGMSYGGAKTIKKLQEKAEFVLVTNAGMRESNYHDIDM